MDIGSLLNLFNSSSEAQSVAGNTPHDYLLAVVIFVVLVIVLKFAQWVILGRLAKLAEKTRTDIDDTLIEIVKSLKPGFYYFVAFFFAVQALVFSPLAQTVIYIILIAWVAAQVVIGLQILIDYAINKKLGTGKSRESGQGILLFMGKLVKGALWIVAVLMVLSNLGVDVTSLMAGLGIGGLAIAFALQNVFADLFSAFSIYLDKPFEVGDFIVVGDLSGTVEKIGIKTTRIRALQGEEIVISNQKLTTADVHNYKKLRERRVVASFGVTYDTSNEKLKEIPHATKKVVDGTNGARFDRTHFASFGDSALLFELVYYVESENYAAYMDVQQNINLGMKEVFEKLGVDFAYPTQHIILDK